MISSLIGWRTYAKQLVIWMCYSLGYHDNDLIEKRPRLYPKGSTLATCTSF